MDTFEANATEHSTADIRTSMPAALIDVRLTAIRYAARDINLLELKQQHREPLPAYEPGAHIDVHLPNGLVRSYSLIVAEPDAYTYTLAIKREANGRGGSRYVHDSLRVGSLLKISPPRNHFPLDETAHCTVLLAGGIGITPISCMAQRLQRLKRDWRLFYACRSRADMALCDTLADLPTVMLHFDDESSGHPIDIQRIVADAPRDAHLYCCGPQPMLRLFEAATLDWPRSQVHVEYFSANANAKREGGGHSHTSSLGARVFNSEWAKHSPCPSGCRYSNQLLLRTRHLRCVRAARAVWHPGAQRFGLDSRTAG